MAAANTPALSRSSEAARPKQADRASPDSARSRRSGAALRGRRWTGRALIVGSCLVAGVARAQSLAAPPLSDADSSVSASTQTERSPRPWYDHPALFGLSAGYYEALRSNHRENRAADFRIEYRSGLSLLPLISPRILSSLDPVFQIRPMAGLEGTSADALYAFGGLMFDLFLGPHLFISPNEVVGLYGRGNGKELGSAVEFRSTLEVGYRFDNAARISVSVGHISNAKLSAYNPGTELLSAHIYVPIDWGTHR
jgi:lipid A 3-O-deacylase